MLTFELVLALLLGGVVLAALARRVGAPYPALLALAGAALALVPDTPRVMLDPQLALALFVAPVLLDSAFDASPRDLRHHWLAVTSLALFAVAATIVTVALVARALVPGLPWAAAVALGAIVAPPDAAAASAVLRQLRPPHRLLVILEGESLFNDASALLVYRLAVGAAATGAVTAGEVAPALLFSTVGSVALGLALAHGWLWIASRVEEVAMAVILQFVGTFGVWLLAERLHLSGIITMVAYAMWLGRQTPARIPARVRVPSYAVWEVAVFVLNVLAFILVGLQLKVILEGVDRPTLVTFAVTSLAVTAAVMLVRVVAVMGTAGLWSSRWQSAPDPRRDAGTRRGTALRSAAVVSWCGMRGTVTLAAALALPADFPYRGLVVFTAFNVVLGTLVLQGLSLRPLLSWLGLADDGEVARELREARVAALRAGVRTLEPRAGSSPLVDASLAKYRVQLARAEAAVASEADWRQELREEDAVLRAAQAAERATLVRLRADGTIGDDAFHLLEEELDRAELLADATLSAPRLEPDDGRGVAATAREPATTP